MSIRTFLGLAALAGGITAFTTFSDYNKKEFSIEVQIQGECAFDTLRLYTWSGLMVQEYQKTALLKEKNWTGFRFRFKQRPPLGMYYLGKDLSDLKHVVLDDKDKKITFVGACDQPTQWTTENSPVNQAYESVMFKVKTNNEVFFTQVQDYQTNIKDQAKTQAIQEAMAKTDANKKALLDSVRKVQPFLAKIVALNTYYSYWNNRKDAQQIEGQYFAEQFFAQVDLADTVYRRTPYFFEAVQAYSANLTRVGLTAAQQETYLEAMLAKLQNTSHPNYQSMLLAMTFGVMAGSDALFLKYGKRYVELFQGKNVEIDNFINQRLSKLRGPTTIGEVAPNIREMKPDGTYMELKDLRGKYVLIDFWASWCGPCRKENPNVVKLYEKYKSKGFDVFGVSLDKTKEPWLDAIQKDGLVWHHVSDLKGWSAAAAQAYGVTAIPFTVLIDKEGRIIGTRLRGAELETKLKEIFGE